MSSAQSSSSDNVVCEHLGEGDEAACEHDDVDEESKHGEIEIELCVVLPHHQDQLL